MHGRHSSHAASSCHATQASVACNKPPHCPPPSRSDTGWHPSGHFWGVDSQFSGSGVRKGEVEYTSEVVSCVWVASIGGARRCPTLTPPPTYTNESIFSASWGKPRRRDASAVYFRHGGCGICSGFCMASYVQLRLFLVVLFQPG